MQNISNWFWNNEYAIDGPEQKFAEFGGDVIQIAQEVKSPLQGLVEKISHIRKWAFFKPKHSEVLVESKTTYYHDTEAIEAFVNAILIAFGLLLFLAPVWSLQFILNDIKRLAVITAFIVLFATILASATAAKPFETLAATAA